MRDDLFVNMLLEYMNNTYNRYERDFQLVRNRIDVYGLNADDYYDLIVCQIRLDCAASQFRCIRQLLKDFMY